VTHVHRALGMMLLFVVAAPTRAQQTPPDYPGVMRAIYKEHTDPIRCVAVDTNGKFIASGSVDKTVRLWDTTTGKQRHVLQHSGTVTSVAFSADGKKLAAGDADMQVILWDVDTGKKLATLKGVAGSVLQVAFSRDGKKVAAGGKSGRLWDVATGKEKITFEGRFALSPDGTTLALARADGAIQLWDATTDKALVKLKGHSGGVLAMAFSPDGKTLASGPIAGGIKGSDVDKSIKIWGVARGEERASLVGHLKGIYSLTFAPDSKALIAADFNGSMKLWDVDNARILATLEKVKIGERVQGTPVGQWAIASDLKTWAVGAGLQVQYLDIADFTRAAQPKVPAGKPTTDPLKEAKS
jgi:WD40 repeat protein